MSNFDEPFYCFLCGYDVSFRFVLYCPQLRQN